MILCPICHGTEHAYVGGVATFRCACGHVWNDSPELRARVGADARADREAAERRARKAARRHRHLLRNVRREYLKRRFAEGGAL